MDVHVPALEVPEAFGGGCTPEAMSHGTSDFPPPPPSPGPCGGGVHFRRSLVGAALTKTAYQSLRSSAARFVNGQHRARPK